ncbi:MAG: hypothetical protein ACKPKO_42080, partial [Candidatus Fonsibacter sp.]
VPDADLLPDHRLLVKVGKEALGLVQDDHVVSEVEPRTAQDVVAPLEYVHQAVELDDEARGGSGFDLRYDMIILDESESLLAHFDEQTMVRKEIGRWKLFE